MNFDLRLFGGRGGAFGQAAAGEVGHILRGFSEGNWSLNNFVELKKEGADLLRNIYESQDALAARGQLIDISASAVDRLEEFANHVVDNVRELNPNGEDYYRKLRDIVGTKAWYMTPMDRHNIQNLGELSRYVRTTTDDRAKPINVLFNNIEGSFPSFFSGAGKAGHIQQADMYAHLASTIKSASEGRFHSLRQHNSELAAELAGELQSRLGSIAFPRAAQQANRRKK